MTENKEKVYILEPVNENYSEERFNELNALISSADGVCVGACRPVIRLINASTYIGSGKLSEIKLELDELKPDCVVFDGELSPSKTQNLSEALGGVKVIDRTALILDIFAKNAVTSEGKLQVELAQLKYIYPRLKGKGVALSRLGGGIGTRGPGETKLETDRRYIRERIKNLENSLKNLVNKRDLQERRRKKTGVKTVALVGYTNTGKSTLLNALTEANVYADDKLFATLDATARRLPLKGPDVLLIDTVGFLRDIPHSLIEAFKSTLRVAVSADLLINVCDASSKDWESQTTVTLDMLAELGCKAPVLTVVNKCDLADEFADFPKGSVFISAKSGAGLKGLLDKINEMLTDSVVETELFIKYTDIGEFNRLKSLIIVKEEYYTDGGLTVKARLPKDAAVKFDRFISR